MDEIFRTDIENPKYTRDKQISITGNRYWGDRKDETGLTINYLHDNNYNRGFNNLLRKYYPTANYDNKISADSSKMIQHDRNHKLDISSVFSLNKLGLMMVSTSLQYTEQLNKNTITSHNVVNNLNNQRFIDEEKKHTSKGLEPKINWMSVYKEDARFIPMLMLRANLFNQDGSELRVDTLSAEIGQKLITSSPFGQQRDYGGGIALRYAPKIKSNEVAWNMSAGYEIDYTNNKRIKYAFDLFRDTQNPDIDSVNTYEYTYNYRNHKAKVDLNYSRKSVSLFAEVGFTSSILNKDETFPEIYEYGRTFSHVSSRLNLKLKKGFYSILNATYDISANLPSIEQQRFQIDDINPITLITGNPSIKKEYIHDIRLILNPYHSTKDSNLSFNINTRIWDNYITSRNTFFKEDTFLDKYDYTAKSNSTLYSYDNIDGVMNISVGARYSLPLRKIKSTLQINGKYDLNKSGSYIEDMANKINGDIYSLGAGLFGTLSNVLRTGITTNSTYNNYSSGYGLNNKYYRFSASANINYSPSIYIFGVDHRSMWERHNINKTNNNQRHILNIVAGVYFYKRNGAITISAFDILNKDKQFKTILSPEYFERSISPTFGRYWIINLSYKFNSSKSANNIRTGGF